MVYLNPVVLSPDYFNSLFCIAELGCAAVAQFRGSAAAFNTFIIPPTRFVDLSGMMTGVQSERLEDPAALYRLCLKLGVNPDDPKWKVARTAFEVTLRPVVARRSAEELLNNTIVHEFLQAVTSDPKIDWKSKIRVLLKNNTGKTIVVSGLQWDARASDASLQVAVQSFAVFQVESTRG